MVKSLHRTLGKPEEGQREAKARELVTEVRPPPPPQKWGEKIKNTETKEVRKR